MNLFIWALILAAATLTILAFGSPAKSDAKRPATKNGGKKTKEDKQDLEESKISGLENQIISLKAELVRLSAEYVKAQDELEVTKKQGSDLREELSRQKEWYNREQAELGKVKKDNLVIKESLINKEKDLESEFSLNLNLNNELKEAKQRLESLEKENREMSDKIRTLEAQITGYNKEIERQNTIISEMKKKEQESEWISKSEYNELKGQLEAKEQELKRLQGQ